MVERIANLSSLAELDPAYLAEGVGLLAAINLVLSFVKLLATYGRKLFALVDAAKAITGHGAGSEGDDGTVQVYETMTNLEAVAILDLLNKPAVKAKFGDGVSFGELVRKDKLDFEGCDFVDDDLAGVVALVTHPEMAARGSRWSRTDGALIRLEEGACPRSAGRGLAARISWTTATPTSSTRAARRCDAELLIGDFVG